MKASQFHALTSIHNISLASDSQHPPVTTLVSIYLHKVV